MDGVFNILGDPNPINGGFTVEASYHPGRKAEAENMPFEHAHFTVFIHDAAKLIQLDNAREIRQATLNRIQEMAKEIYFTLDSGTR